ncbi:alpha/beta hydrolase [Christensenellaceae bacterium OttesenSCG-928-K19]|nr:alpha/beta hydrolase [Christensenellaceae bacterium OttesenSCG-928-K19]
MITICVVLAIFVGLVSWNLAALAAVEREYPPEGVRVGVFDTKVSVFTAGQRQKDRPAIVFLSGLATPSPVADFYPLWSRLCGDYFVVVLERPGYGWSRQTERERTLENIVEEDRLALDKLGIAPPYVFAAHSMGGIEAHYYAERYSEEVEGLVFIDSMSPALMLHYGDTPVSLLDKAVHPLRLFGLLRLIYTAAPKTVLDRLEQGRNGREYMSEYYKQVEEIALLKTYQSPAMLEEKELRLQNAAAANEVVLPTGIPATLIVSVTDDVDRDSTQFAEYMDFQQLWMAQSLDGEIVFVDGGHYVHQYSPDEVCGTIRDMMEKAG